MIPLTQSSKLGKTIYRVRSYDGGFLSGGEKRHEMSCFLIRVIVI